MITVVGDSTVQQILRATQDNEVNERQVQDREAVRLRRERPVEKTGAGGRSEMRSQGEDTSRLTTRHRIEEGQIILERYDQHGKLVEKIPPGYVPFGEFA
jgi:hypothetical protein